jgi:hypothetical protein
MSDGKYITFLIWKDYNCIKWITVDLTDKNFPTSSYTNTDSNSIKTAIQTGYASRNLDDIWLAAQSLQATIATVGGNIFSDKLAYSVIATPTMQGFFFCKVCAKDYIYFTTVGAKGGNG